MLTKKEKKEYVFKKLDEVLKPQGYKGFKTGGSCIRFVGVDVSN
ncbi:hypothetical protein [Bergeyella porcorum]